MIDSNEKRPPYETGGSKGSNTQDANGRNAKWFQAPPSGQV
jgi:hypothetical protein